jgi:hypothetical protein
MEALLLIGDGDGEASGLEASDRITMEGRGKNFILPHAAMTCKQSNAFMLSGSSLYQPSLKLLLMIHITPSLLVPTLQTTAGSRWVVAPKTSGYVVVELVLGKSGSAVIAYGCQRVPDISTITILEFSFFASCFDLFLLKEIRIGDPPCTLYTFISCSDSLTSPESCYALSFVDYPQVICTREYECSTLSYPSHVQFKYVNHIHIRQRPGYHSTSANS